MYTQCPHCKTTFRIAEAHLKAAKGMVRCGSCQEIFDATKHLTSGMPGESKPVRSSPPVVPPKAQPKPPPAPKPVPPPVKTENKEPPFSFLNEDDHEHIDLSTPTPRENVPDQTPFMDSIYDEHSAYNNLDQMGPIHIPGELNFGDSIIKIVDDKDKDSAKENVAGTQSAANNAGKSVEVSELEQPPPPANQYEDMDSKEAPASTSDRAVISELYKFADDQLQLNEDEQLAKNIEELLSYAADLDDKPAGKTARRDKTGLELDNFEKELDDLDLHSPLQFNEPAKKTSPTPVSKSKADERTEDEFADLEIDFDLDEPAGMVTKAANETDSATAEVAATDETEQPQDTKPEKPVPEEELPSAEFEIPKALRSNFDSLVPAERPLGLTVSLIAATIVLSLGFVFQLMFFRSYELANMFPALNPALVTLCESIPCRYSGSIDVSKIELLNRDVRSHPSQKNTLLISAAFVNNARFNQPYPTIAVKLSDLGGNIVATRHFRPEEYLEQLYNKFLLMEAGTPVHITLAVLDPGDDAINFEFSFLQ